MLQKDILDNHSGISYIIDKRYFLILLYLNCCIEPFYHHELECDFYEDGHNYTLASVLYLTGPSLWGEKNYIKLLSLFQNAVRSKCEDDVKELCHWSNILLKINDKLREVLFPLSIKYPGSIQEIISPGNQMDIIKNNLMSLIFQNEQIAEDKYELIHDTMKELPRYDQMLSVLTKNNDDKVVIKQPYGRKLSFPLKLSSIKQKESHNSRGLQLADILAGGIFGGAKRKIQPASSNNYYDSILPLYSEQNLMHMRPNPDIYDISDGFVEADTQSAIKFFSSIYRN